MMGRISLHSTLYHPLIFYFIQNLPLLNRWLAPRLIEIFGGLAYLLPMNRNAGVRRENFELTGCQL